MRKTIEYTPLLSEEVSNSASIKERNKFHVISTYGGNWSVLKDGNIKATKVFSNESEAIEFAKQEIEMNKGVVIIHSDLGEVKDTIKM